MLPPWCYPYPAPVPLVGGYGAGPNAPLGVHGHGPNMPYHDPNMPYHDVNANMPYHNPNMPYPGFGGTEYPIWNRTQTYASPLQQTEPQSAPSAEVNSVQAPNPAFEAEEDSGQTDAEPAKTAKTLNSSKRSTTVPRDKSIPNKSKKQNVSSKRKNPWIKG